MKAQKLYLIASVTLVAVGFAAAVPARKAAANNYDSQFIASSSLLAGLAPGAVFPFIDTTPHTISQAHIAITDATASCGGSQPTAPSNVQILVGQAGVALVPVISGATNTGISTTPGQCVFHVTVTAGQGGVPNTVTDIVVLNGGSSPLTGVNTVTASATVRVDDVVANWHQHGNGGSAGH